MLQTLKHNVLFPLMGRVGTAVATALVGYGVHSSYAEQIGVAVSAVALVCFDLVTSYVLRERAKRGMQ